MTKDFSALSAQDLEDMSERLLSERQKRHTERLNREIAELRQIAEERGFLVEEIFVPHRIKPAPKYRNPADPDQTWSGKGRRPDWLNALLDDGHDLESLRIR